MIVDYLEVIAVLFGLVGIYFSVKENILVFPIGLVNTVLYTYLCVSVGLYGEGSLNLYYTIMNFVGWYSWSNKKNKEALSITKMNLKEWLLIIIYFIILFFVIFLILKYFSDTTVLFWDSIATAIAFIAMYLMTKKKIEHWYWWIVTDLISIPLFIHKELPISSIQFFAYIALSLFGIVSWKKKLSYQ